MRPRPSTVAAAIAFAALVVAIVVVARSSASGTPGGARIAAATPRQGVGVAEGTLTDCALPRGGGPSRIPLTGVCTGTLTAAFTCARSTEELALTIRRPLGGRNVFYLTILIPDFTGPGGYPESEAFVQVTGPPNALRWSRRDAITRVDPDGTILLGRFVFAPEPGTPATGQIRLHGRAACASSDRAAVRKRWP